ncbi:phasin family protein [Azospirillum sp. TSO22-1]|uniref:phasin family protein n=1 Tax=Azospirillum sp. TSO22-1 TaxID=716789 RepID=UPI001304F5F5|nr:phasin family protein [Azospirillum sp. TSO22-1]
MADGTPPVRTIRSASDEAAAKTESSKTHTIQSASGERATKAASHDARQPHDHSARPFDRMAAQAGRDFVEQATSWPAQQFGTGGELAGRTVQGITRQTDQNLTLAMELGNVMASSYEAACSEIVKHMQQAAQRQNEMLNDMLRARSPSDVLLAGNRYLLGGLQAFFDTSARIAQASAHTADEAGQKRIRRAA